MINNTEQLRYSYFFIWEAWIWVFSIGLPILAATLFFGWRRAANSYYWRFLVCMVFASLVTPTFLQEDDWGNPRLIDIIPSVITIIVGIVAAAHGEGKESFTGMFSGLIPILVVAAILYGVWAVIIRIKQNGPAVMTRDDLPSASE